MDDRACMVDTCDQPPAEELTVESSGLLLVYAVCPAHLVAIRAGAMIAQAPESNRGFIGLA
ncbi:hypothetical protein [Subtercola boreus]|uniref:hypothetical protein n=1 Tax=Subtercola boreus TaxID=120213 RepID=UPI0011C04B0C|nr:hypothetical protein [Subtercola boreus]